MEKDPVSESVQKLAMDRTSGLDAGSGAPAEGDSQRVLRVLGGSDTTLDLAPLRSREPYGLVILLEEAKRAADELGFLAEFGSVDNQTLALIYTLEADALEFVWMPVAKSNSFKYFHQELTMIPRH